jgi:acyl-CoA thioesterase
MARGPASPDPLAHHLGFEVVERGLGRAVLRAVVGPEHLNRHGIGHGGFVFALADTAFAVAGDARHAPAVATSCSIHFVRPVRAGDVLLAEAREVAAGRSTGTYEVTVRRDGEVVAVSSGTAHRLRRDPAPRG